jgi:hypothetical protein
VGKVLHAFVLGSAAGQEPNIAVSDSGSRYDPTLGVHYSIDWDKGDIAEFKSSRAFHEPTTIEGLGIYVEQTLVYMAIKQVLEGQIWVLYLNLRDEETKRTNPQFRCYRIRISSSDLQALRDQLSGLSVQIRQAVQQHNHNTLPLCREWKCGATNCVYWHQCKPEGRYAPVPSASELQRAEDAPKH